MMMKQISKTYKNKNRKVIYKKKLQLRKERLEKEFKERK